MAGWLAGKGTDLVGGNGGGGWPGFIQGKDTHSWAAQSDDAAASFHQRHEPKYSHCLPIYTILTPPSAILSTEFINFIRRIGRELRDPFLGQKSASCYEEGKYATVRV